MTKLETNTNEGEFWADKLMDLANLEIIVMVFGQFASSRILWHIVIVGVIIYMIIVNFSIKLRSKKI